MVGGKRDAEAIIRKRLQARFEEARGIDAFHRDELAAGHQPHVDRSRRRLKRAHDDAVVVARVDAEHGERIAIASFDERHQRRIQPRLVANSHRNDLSVYGHLARRPYSIEAFLT